MKKLEYIDALRGIGMIGILLNHFRPDGDYTNPTTVQLILLNTGQGCLQSLYVISAFTIFLSYTKRRNSETKATSNFFIRRFFRIAPLYYVACIYFICRHAYLIENNLIADSSIGKWKIISNFLLIHGFNPYWIHGIVPVGWSVAIEAQFYLLLPLLIKKIKNLNGAIIFFLGSFLFNAFLKFFITKLNLPIMGIEWQTFMQYWVPNQLPTFACGIILFFIMTTPKSEWKINLNAILISSIFIFLDLISGKKLLVSDMTFYAINFIGIVYVVSKKNYRIINNKITRHLGEVNYGIYLFHYPVLAFMFKLNLIDPMRSFFGFSPFLSYTVPFLCFLVLNVAFATILNKLIEKPFQKLGALVIRNTKKTKPDILTPQPVSS